MFRQTRLLIWLLLPLMGKAQWQPQQINTKSHFRAVHALSSQVVWAGGTKGTVLRTLDGGLHWQVLQVAGAEALDFRDVHAFDAQNALAMSAGEAEKGAARIYRTTDGGQTWVLCYQTNQKGVFLDGIDFWDAQNGLVFGDPIDGKFFLLSTHNAGKSWEQIDSRRFPTVQNGEAAFAASGTSMVLAGKKQAFIGTGGGTTARVYRSSDRGASWEPVATPLSAGTTSGIFGLHFQNNRSGVAVGGDYKLTTLDSPNVLLTSDAGRHWQLAATTSPVGLKEAVAYLPSEGIWVVVGPSGTCYSSNVAQQWHVIDQSSFHALSCAEGVCWAVGANGAVAKLPAKSLTSKR